MGLNTMNTHKILLFALLLIATPLAKANDINKPVRTRVEQLSTDAYKTALSLQLILSDQNIGEALFFYTKTNQATLSSLFINEAYRLLHYGSKLFRLVCSLLKNKGCKKLTWKACPFTFPRNEQPHELPGIVSFFEKLGARVVEYQDYVHGMPTTAVMTINL
jgi:hypothetical protein